MDLQQVKEIVRIVRIVGEGADVSRHNLKLAYHACLQAYWSYKRYHGNGAPSGVEVKVRLGQDAAEASQYEQVIRPLLSDDEQREVEAWPVQGWGPPLDWGYPLPQEAKDW